jgi:hypothetical protein
MLFLIYRGENKWSWPWYTIMLIAIISRTHRLRCLLWQDFSLVHKHMQCSWLGLRSSCRVMGQYLWVTIWHWPSLYSHPWPHLLHILAKSVAYVSFLTYRHSIFSTNPYWVPLTTNHPNKDPDPFKGLQIDGGREKLNRSSHTYCGKCNNKDKQDNKQHRERTHAHF